jgi:hypothetical protein
MSMEGFRAEVDQYGYQLGSFRAKARLPEYWFNYPDHIAYKTAGLNNFSDIVAQFSPESKKITVDQVDDRFIAAAELLGGVLVPHIGKIRWVEIMEPRPGKVGIDLVGIDHLEFYVEEGLEAIKKGLDRRGRIIPYKFEDNDSHEWIAVKINGVGQEVKFTDTQLAEITENSKPINLLVPQDS